MGCVFSRALRPAVTPAEPSKTGENVMSNLVTTVARFNYLVEESPKCC